MLLVLGECIFKLIKATTDKIEWKVLKKKQKQNMDHQKQICAAQEYLRACEWRSFASDSYKLI